MVAQSPSLTPPRRYALAAAACVLTTVVATPLRHHLDLANIVMLYLLTVFLLALRLGRGPAVMAAFLSVALFDFFFVPPRLTFAVQDAQYLVTFAVMLAVGLVTAQLTAGIRRQAELAGRREAQTRDLYELARELAGTIAAEQVAEAVGRYLGKLGCDAAIFVTDDDKTLRRLGAPADAMELNLARMALERGEAMTADALAGTGRATLYLPLAAPMRMRGVIGVAPRGADAGPLSEQRPLFATVASLAAIALERVHYAEVARRTEVDIATERLRSSILSALSHDLRTPLTALVGLADSLALNSQPSRDGDTAAAIRDQARAMHALLSNLLDMARLHAGRLELRREWQLIEEVVGASLQLLKPSLGERPLRVELAPQLPLIEFDAVLIERVLCNLIENAAKYSPAGSPIEIDGRIEDGCARIAVCDRGRGFSPAALATAFDLFVRGEPESPTPGVGLGLAICKAIVEAHGGRIAAANRAGGGACVAFSLPLGTPPAVEAEPQ